MGNNLTNHQVQLTVGRPCGAKDVVSVSSTSEAGERSLHVPESVDQWEVHNKTTSIGF